ncbi:hypothetical protein [Pseudomonas aeruginosa]|uniref:hypothetical protein n=1 Tax=Pseudomonas aeruginosa TaxID=287 RepID=UPI0032AF5C9C
MALCGDRHQVAEFAIPAVHSYPRGDDIGGTIPEALTRAVRTVHTTIPQAWPRPGVRTGEPGATHPCGFLLRYSVVVMPA